MRMSSASMRRYVLVNAAFPFTKGNVCHTSSTERTGEQSSMEKLCLDTNLPREGYERILRKQEEMARQKAERR